MVPIIHQMTIITRKEQQGETVLEKLLTFLTASVANAVKEIPLLTLHTLLNELFY